MARNRGTTSNCQRTDQADKSGQKTKVLSTNDFLAKGLETDSDEEMDNHSEEEDSGESDNDEVSLRKHKQSLERLKDQDPEFYKFLKQEDSGLLELDSDDECSDVDSDADGSCLKEKTKKRGNHKPPQKLEVASDDSEVEDGSSDDDEAKVKSKKIKVTAVTPKMIALWSKSLKASNVMAMQNTVSAFKAAVQEASSEGSGTCKYRVEGSGVFNGVVRLCLTELRPAFHRFLDLTPSKLQKPVLPSSSPKWRKIRLLVKSYLTDTLQLLSSLGEQVVLNTILKHTSQLTIFYVCFPKLAKAVLKKCISLWSSGDETTRVLAFLIINRITRLMQDRLLDVTLKQMYMAYVKNCKFTSPSLLPMINFMQRTLVEMFAIDMEKAYQYGFIYVRQLAIHLRNAITLKKKENCQAVYNWQYVHSLQFWARFLAELRESEVVGPLVYPLTQVIMGTIKLVPTARYFPLRFHCVRTLNLLSGATGVYMPVLPLLLEVFEMTDFNKHHKAVSFKPLNFAVILKLSKAQLQEKAFRDGLIDQLYELLLETFNVHAHTVGFPELALPAVLQLKQFVKHCKVANYTKQIKQILEKVNTTAVVISHRRKSASFDIADVKAIEAWERRSKEEGTPLGKYHTSWRRMRDRELVHEIAGKERISTDNLPTIDRSRIPKKATKEERIEFADLFNTDSEDEDDEARFLPKNQRPKKKQKTRHVDDTDTSDYSDLDPEDLQKLAGSADEEDEVGEETNEDSSDAEESEEGSNDGQMGSHKMDISEGEQKDIVQDFVFSDDEEDE